MKAFLRCPIPTRFMVTKGREGKKGEGGGGGGGVSGWESKEDKWADIN